jgi:hypothetical protein
MQDQNKLEIPKVLEPTPTDSYILLVADPKKVFPDDIASKWMLGLLAAHNDISIALRMFAAYLTDSDDLNSIHGIYRSGYQYYFWRLLYAHNYEALLLFEEANESQNKLIEAIWSDEEVRAKFAQLNELLETKSVNDVGEIKVREILRGIRLVTFHYKLDGEPFPKVDWMQQLTAIKPDTPLSIYPASNKLIEGQHIIAHEYNIAKLNLFNFSDRKIHQEVLNKLSGEMVRLIEICLGVYVRHRPDFKKKRYPDNAERTD